MKAIKNILGNNIWLKISAFNSLSVITRFFSGWIINKLIAYYIGPQGTSVTEQFRNFLQTLQGVSSVGMSEGVTKYAAEYQEKPKILQSFLASAYKIVMITSLFLSVLTIVFASQINTYLFDTRDFTTLIIISGVLLPFLAFQLILTAVLNGFQEYKKVTYINILANTSSALMALYLVVWHGIYGALILVLLTQLALLVYTLIYIQKDLREIRQALFQKTDVKHYKRLRAYILMALVSVMIIPVFNILLRNQINAFFEGDKGVHAGYWDGVKKISGLFLSFIMPIFTLYFYPQLSKIHTNKAYFVEVKKFFIQIFPLFTIGMIVLYFLRHLATLIFYSDAYIPMEELFLWQLLGDFVKVISMILAFLMLAKAKVAYYIATEIGFWVLFYLITPYFLENYQLKGISMAYFVTYLAYLLILLIVFRRLFTTKTVKL